MQRSEEPSTETVSEQDGVSETEPLEEMDGDSDKIVPGIPAQEDTHALGDAHKL